MNGSRQTVSGRLLIKNELRPNRDLQQIGRNWLGDVPTDALEVRMDRREFFRAL